jgi:hypothetical protein
MRVLAVLLACFACLTFAQITPRKGSAERTAILNALRAPVQKDLKAKVQFKVDHLKMKGAWAFLRGVPQTSKGGKVDYSKTKYKGAIDAGAFDDGICALLKKQNGEWKVVTYVIGATDVAYEPWPGKYGAPKAIFGLP